MAEVFHEVLECPLLGSVAELVLLPAAAAAAPPQLNVFYNVRGEEEAMGRSHGGGHHEAFHLHVELQDVDLNSAHLLICAR